MVISDSKKIDSYDKILNNLKMMCSVSEHLMDLDNEDTAGLMAFFFSASYEAAEKMKDIAPTRKEEIIGLLKNKSGKDKA